MSQYDPDSTYVDLEPESNHRDDVEAATADLFDKEE